MKRMAAEHRIVRFFGVMGFICLWFWVGNGWGIAVWESRKLARLSVQKCQFAFYDIGSGRFGWQQKNPESSANERGSLKAIDTGKIAFEVTNRTRGRSKD
jgi:hypothetical protein